jgi:hypothetical protein
LREVVYDRDAQVARLRRSVDLLVEFLRQNKYGPAPDYLPKAKKRRGQSGKNFDVQNSNMFPLLENLVLDCFVIKSRFFGEEKECRILAVIDASSNGIYLTECDFRSHADRIIPYRTFPPDGFRPNAIRLGVPGATEQD